MRYWTVLLLLLLITPAAAQNDTPYGFCGVVDSIDYPIDNLVEGYDDFALYRERFGGRHVGLDIGFDRWGEPVRAVARGRVTLANIEEWDTEKGVVIVEHILPDNSLIYTLYGHMEESDEIKFPAVGDCVEQGTILGGIGWPSRGRPHLHYEIRSILPNEGGPGYVSTSPLDQGWYHPLDFTELWQMRLQPGFVSYASFKSVPSVPPLVLDNGSFVIASGSRIEGTLASGEVLWRIETDGEVTGLAALSDDRVVAYTRNGQALTLQNGRYVALWSFPALDNPFLVLADEKLVFAQQGGGLAAYDAAGTAVWSLPGISSADRLADFKTNGDKVAVGVRLDDDSINWRLIDGAGQVTYETTFDSLPVTAPDTRGNWMALDGTEIRYFVGQDNHNLGNIAPVPGSTPALTTDILGNSYIYLGDAARTLIAVDQAGEIRWRATYPFPPLSLPPLMATGNGCLLYTLDVDGVLNVFDTTTSELVNQVQLYAGGNRNSSPRARLLRVDTGEQVKVSSGFLSMVTLDGWALGGETAANCLLG